MTSIADSYRENLAEHKVVDDEQLEYKDMESMKSGKVVHGFGLRTKNKKKKKRGRGSCF